MDIPLVDEAFEVLTFFQLDSHLPALNVRQVHHDKFLTLFYILILYILTLYILTFCMVAENGIVSDPEASLIVVLAVWSVKFDSSYFALVFDRKKLRL